MIRFLISYTGTFSDQLEISTAMCVSTLPHSRSISVAPAERLHETKRWWAIACSLV